MSELIKPKEITITSIDGEELTYNIGKFPALDGYEIIANYPKTILNKGESFEEHKEVLVKIFGYVERVVDEKTTIRLQSKALINNHIPDWECIVKILKESGEYNSSFLQLGKAQGFIGQLKAKVPTLIQKILTDSLSQLSKKN